jgi:hypothetical protein
MILADGFQVLEFLEQFFVCLDVKDYCDRYPLSPIKNCLAFSIFRHPERL